jgi:CobQ-like glutamine amidotransferase family enzyme
MTFTIVHLLPELLGTYGDKGNVEILSWRLSKREIAHQVLTIGVGDEIPTSADLYLLGGGEDDAQIAALDTFLLSVQVFRYSELNSRQVVIAQLLDSL